MWKDRLLYGITIRTTCTLYTAWNASLKAPWPSLGRGKSDCQRRSGLQKTTSIKFEICCDGGTYGFPMIPPDWITSHSICTMRIPVWACDDLLWRKLSYHLIPNFEGHEIQTQRILVLGKSPPAVHSRSGFSHWVVRNYGRRTHSTNPPFRRG